VSRSTGQRSSLALWRDAVRDHSGIDTTTTAVAMVLSTYMDGDRWAWPSRETLAHGAKLKSVRSVDRAIQMMVEAGLLRVHRSKGRHPNRYQGTVQLGAWFATVQPDALLEGANRASDDAQPCISRQATVQPTAHESSTECKDEGRTATASEVAPEEVRRLLEARGFVKPMGAS
jgi:hypothetical protein